ncbi:MAG: dihydrofolate reductase family protein [Chloroflexi bacterium]|nr:dihydrofolate reductase family protein [Chloroflexota bacterium]
MRKLIVCNIMSLDGYYEGEGGDVMPLFDYRHDYPTDQSFDEYNVERIKAADTMLLGSRSYLGFKGFWPSVQDDPSFPDTAREFSRLDNAIDKVVISDSLTMDDTGPWHDTTRIIRRAGAHEHIAELKQQPGKEILMFGSHILWNDLLAHGLVDELHLMISPLVLGGGTPLFNDQTSSLLRLIDTRTWDGSGLVLVRYDVSGQ